MNAFLTFIKSNTWALVTVYIITILAVICLLLFLLLVFLVFYNTTLRNPFKKRTRECSQKKDALQAGMFKEGVEWAQAYKEKTEQLHIVNNGLNLYGEYLNLGFEKCCIILQGRAESLLYCYYYAAVFARNGYNILVVDTRAHGLSDGRYQTGGIKESDDIILWIKHINEKYNITDFTIHGICIGAATAIFAYSKLKKENCNLLKRIITDGLYPNYLELYKAHARAFKVNLPPAYIYAAFLLIFLFARVNAFKGNPINYIKDIDIPILFICSYMDKLCIKQESEELFKECASEQKEICFFPKGRHSHIRAAQKTEYDERIEKFLQKHI